MSNVDSDFLSTTTKLSISSNNPVFESDDEDSNILVPQNNINSGIGSNTDSDSNSTSTSTSSSRHNILVQNGSTKDEVSKRRRSSAASVNSISKKLHKRKLKKINGKPDITINVDEVRIHYIRDLIMTIYTGIKHTKKLDIAYGDNVSKVVYVIIDGIDRNDFSMESKESGEHTIASNYPFINENFNRIIPSVNPGDKICLFPLIDAITSIHLTKKESKDILAASKLQKITINDLLLTVETMKYNGYPIHSSLKSNEVTENESDDKEKYSQETQDEQEEGWIETEFKNQGSHIFALDCEFCLCKSGHELARISILNFDGTTIFDSFVKPVNPITDYLTQYSGITPELLSGVETTLSDIQTTFKSLIAAEDILVGHSLESDLNVMKIRHPNIVDTSLCYHHARGPPFKPGLKQLSRTHLNREIQMGNDGHSSVEDSLACLDLVKLKIIEGKLFGENYKSDSIFKRIKSNRLQRGKSEIKGLFIDHNSKISDSPLFKTIGVDNLPKSSDHEQDDLGDEKVNDDKIIETYHQECNNHNFVIVSLKDLENLNENLNSIYSELPDNSLFIVSSTNTDKVQRLTRQKNEFKKFKGDIKDYKGEIWDFEKDTELKSLIQDARQGISFMKIK